mgnify:CR=1 FL=1
MRAVVQRVTSAEVRSRTEPGGVFETVGRIERGLCVLVGVTHADQPEQADRLVSKLAGLRVFDDEDGVMNVGALEAGADFLVVSQFTLYGDTRKGRRPSWTEAAAPAHAEPLVQRVVDGLLALGATVASGRFRTDMRVALVNDGPVTLIIEM